MPETCLQVLFVIFHACLRGHCSIDVYNTSIVGVFPSDQMVIVSKASCQAHACLFNHFLCKSSKIHTSTHVPFLTYLSLDSISAITASLLCDHVLKKLHKPTGIKETAYRKSSSSFKGQGQDQSKIVTRQNFCTL